MRFGLISSINAGASFVSVAVAISLAVAGFGYWSLVLRDVVRSIFVAIGLWWACPWIPSLPVRGAGVGAMMRFGGHVSLVQMVTLLSQNVGAIVIGRLFGAGPVGLYRQSQNLVEVPFEQLSGPVWIVGEPALSRLQDEPERYQRYFSEVLMLFSSIAMPLAIFLILYGDSVVLIVLGPAWVEAATIFKILAVSAFLTAVSSTIGLAMVTCGRSKSYLSLGLIGACVFVASILLGALWGTVGVAWAHVVAACVMLWPRLHFGLKGTPISKGVFLTALSRPAFASAGMLAVLVSVRAYVPSSSPVSDIALGISVGFAAFASCWLALPGGRATVGRMWGHVVGALPGRR